jgi:hypothetical protein
MATAALVTGLGGLVIGISAPVAIVLGIVALRQIKRTGQDGRGMAIAGLVIGSTLTLLYTALILFVIIVGSTYDDDYGAPAPTSSTSAVVTVDDEPLTRSAEDSHR